MVFSPRPEDHVQDAGRHDQREGRILTRSSDLKVAITTDWLTSYGGAERVLEELLELYPSAPIYAAVYHPPAVSAPLRAADVRTTWLQRLPLVRQYSRALLPLMPGAFSALDLDSFDIVISVTTSFAKTLSLGPSTRHLCYCNTPPRYLWDLEDEYLGGRIGGSLLKRVAAHLRDVDFQAAQRVDCFVGNSANVVGRIRRAYRRDATMIYPPVQTDLFQPVPSPTADYFLVVSRLVRYKRIDLAVDACTRLGLKLIVAGSGPERKRLEAMAGPTVQFVGSPSDAEIAALYANCRALLFPGLEDFGIAPVEAQSAGRPVIAFAQGGALETVSRDVTGLFFEEQTTDALVDAIERMARLRFEPSQCRANAKRFDASVFRSEVSNLVTAVLSTPARTARATG